MFKGRLEDVYRNARGCVYGGWRMVIGRLEDVYRKVGGWL